MADALWHLGTPITGRLRETSTTALDLALSLHPTPAVGGVPTAAASELIGELEGDRGFYVVRTSAEADYDVAKQRCDAKTGNEKDVCVKEAKAAQVKAKADAKAGEKTASARKDASEDKRDADYKVAIEKCDAFAGAVKDTCVRDAKVRFGKT